MIAAWVHCAETVKYFTIGNGEENLLISHYIFLMVLPHCPFSRLSILNFLVVLLGQVSYAYLSHMSQFWIFERTDLTCER